MAGIKGRPKKYFVDVAWLRDVYEVQQRPHGEIAAQIGCTADHLKRLVIAHGLTPRDGRKGRVVDIMRASFDVEYATILYVDRKWNCDQIGAYLGVHGCTIRRRLRETGVKIRHHNDTKRGRKSRNRIELDPEAVIAAYRKPRASALSVAAEFSVSNTVIQRILDENGIIGKSIGEIRQWNGSAHPRWRHDLTDEERSQRRDIRAQAEWRLRVYRRDRFTCQKCGDAGGNNLHAHHIEPHYRNKDSRWDVANGVTFCADCHRLYHRIYGFKRANRETLQTYLSENVNAGQLRRSSGGLGQKFENSV